MFPNYNRLFNPNCKIIFIIIICKWLLTLKLSCLSQHTWEIVMSVKIHCRCDLPWRSSLIQVNSFIIDFNLFFLRSGFLSTLPNLAVGFCPVGYCPEGFCPSGLLSQWAFVRSPVWFAFLETESVWGVQERLPEIVTPKYLAEGTVSRTVPWSIYLVWMGHLVLVICRTWHLGGLKLMSHLFSHNSRILRSFCRVIDSPSELIGIWPYHLLRR